MQTVSCPLYHNIFFFFSQPLLYVRFLHESLELEPVSTWQHFLYTLTYFSERIALNPTPSIFLFLCPTAMHHSEKNELRCSPLYSHYYAIVLYMRRRFFLPALVFTSKRAHFQKSFFLSLFTLLDTLIVDAVNMDHGVGIFFQSIISFTAGSLHRITFIFVQLKK